VMNCG